MSLLHLWEWKHASVHGTQKMMVVTFILHLMTRKRVIKWSPPQVSGVTFSLWGPLSLRQYLSLSRQSIKRAVHHERHQALFCTNVLLHIRQMMSATDELSDWHVRWTWRSWYQRRIYHHHTIHYNGRKKVVTAVEVLQHSLSTTLKRLLKLLVQQIDRCFDTMCYLPKLFCCLHSSTRRWIKLFNPAYLLWGDT